MHTTTDELIGVAYDAQPIARRVRVAHDPRVDPGAYVRALLRELDGEVANGMSAAWSRPDPRD